MPEARVELMAALDTPEVVVVVQRRSRDAGLDLLLRCMMCRLSILCGWGITHLSSLGRGFELQL